MRRISTLAALLALAALPASAGAKPGHGDEAMLTIAPPPKQIEAGDTWPARLRAVRGKRPISHQNIAVTATNHRTGRAQTYYAEETSAGRYLARVVFPTEGDWSLIAQGGGLRVEPEWTAAVDPASGDGWTPWPVLLVAAAALAPFGAVALDRRRRRRRDPGDRLTPVPAEG